MGVRPLPPESAYACILSRHILLDQRNIQSCNGKGYCHCFVYSCDFNAQYILNTPIDCKYIYKYNPIYKLKRSI